MNQDAKWMGLPSGVIRVDLERTREYPSMNSISDIDAGLIHQRTFDVIKKHEKLEGGSGVCFNVETVPSPTQEHLRKPKLGRTEALGRLQQIRIEAASEHENLVHSGGKGFLVALLMAFAQHLPLQLSPDHIWALITYAFTKHVETNAEALRSNFVSHQGKKRLLVETPDSFRMSNPTSNNPDGSPAGDWERIVFADFSQQIRNHIGDETHAAVTADFTTTTPASRAATEIALMAVTKNYFSFGMRTRCGIPNITLLGTEADWVSLRKRAEDLGKLMLPDFTNFWMPLLLPLLDEFVESYRGNVQHGFWQSMVKLRNNGMDSGYAEFISGWMQILFPYLASDRVNKDLRPWHEMFFRGPEPAEFPWIVSSAPVDWDYLGTKFNMDFHAGIIGVTQSETDGTLTPVVGWFVTHSPPKSTRERLKDVQEEVEALLVGHKEEAAAHVVDTTQPWYIRVETLRAEQAQLESKLAEE